jgi:hypothetical protein
MNLQDPETVCTPELKAVLADVSWNEEALSIEIIALCLQSEYNCNDKALIKLAKRFWSGSGTTAMVLEKAFAWLIDIAKRQSKSNKLSAWAMWFYATCSPYVRKSGMPQVEVTKEDWVRMRPKMRMVYEDMKAFHKTFSVSRSSLPEIPAKAINMPAFKKKPWRTAGPIGHHKSVAAIAYMMHDAVNDFVHAPLAWAG